MRAHDSHLQCGIGTFQFRIEWPRGRLLLLLGPLALLLRSLELLAVLPPRVALLLFINSPAEVSSCKEI